MSLVVVDVDGVVADFETAFFRELAALVEPGRLAALREETARGDFGYEWFAALSTPERDEFWARVDADRRWWEGVPPMPCVGPVLGDLVMRAKLRHDVLWATARRHPGEPPAQQTARWLRRHGVDQQPSVLAVGTRKAKIAALRALRPAVVVEDRPATLEALRGHAGALYAVDAPWTRGLEGVTVVPDCAAALRLVFDEGEREWAARWRGSAVGKESTP